MVIMVFVKAFSQSQIGVMLHQKQTPTQTLYILCLFFHSNLMPTEYCPSLILRDIFDYFKTFKHPRQFVRKFTIPIC